MSNPLFAYLILRFIMSRNRIKALSERITKVLWKLNIYVFAFCLPNLCWFIFVVCLFFLLSTLYDIIDIHTENIINLWFNSMNITGFK